MARHCSSIVSSLADLAHIVAAPTRHSHTRWNSPQDDAVRRLAWEGVRGRSRAQAVGGARTSSPSLLYGQLAQEVPTFAHAPRATLLADTLPTQKPDRGGTRSCDSQQPRRLTMPFQPSKRCKLASSPHVLPSGLIADPLLPQRLFFGCGPLVASP